MSSNVIIDPETCLQLPRSRAYQAGPNVAWFTFRNVGHIGGFQFDIFCQIPILANVFFLVNDTVTTNTKYLSLKPLNRGNPSGSAGYTPDGSEQWFPLNVLSFSIGGPIGGPNYATKLRFRDPINQFYLSTGTESGSGGNITIACVADDAMDISGGAWT